MLSVINRMLTARRMISKVLGCDWTQTSPHLPHTPALRPTFPHNLTRIPPNLTQRYGISGSQGRGHRQRHRQRQEHRLAESAQAVPNTEMSVGLYLEGQLLTS